MDKCKKCGGLFYLIEPGRDFARAHICECKKNCTKCGGCGFTVERRKEDKYRYKIACSACSAVHNNVKKYNNARIPAVMAFVEVNAQGTKNMISAAQYVERFIAGYPREKSFILSSSSGRGKTRLAAAAASRLTLRNGIDCLFQDFSDLILRLKSREEGVSESAFLDSCFNAKVLILDGVGMSSRELTDWEKSVFENIVSHRWRRRGKIILTTKYGRSDLESVMGDHGFSKICGMCEFLNLD